MNDHNTINDADFPPSERDSPPWTQEELKRALGTLRDWEQERAEPDATARAFLRAIAGNAEALRSFAREVAAE
jgi:hypothetical protein